MKLWIIITNCWTSWTMKIDFYFQFLRLEFETKIVMKFDTEILLIFCLGRKNLMLSDTNG
ncbi:hypothetical protein DERP_009496 [Dermatophagoides pteronyssinus]|uniref:Uncharacterized protein n=1 Tax=Dermatophagoides pteronyssinus TaxID=6956 RepID=A0ABQ8IUH4_DERPT|nr:hypothetical protein DERP_009496 [Dermatophagoides pteronyssinus]